MRVHHLKVTSSYVISLTFVLGTLTACGHDSDLELNKLDADLKQPSIQSDATNADAEEDERGIKLIDAGRHAAVIEHKHAHESDVQHSQPLSKQQLQYVGRYHAQMSCDQALIDCEKGSVEYLINLLPDGSSHRTIINQGKIYIDQVGSVKSYRKDIWSYDAQDDEVIIHLVEGADLFFQVDPQKNLVLDLDKTLNFDEVNRDFFQNQYPAPSYAYVMRKYAQH